jgi:PPOX class probable FMN-dependent enzyme
MTERAGDHRVSSTDELVVIYGAPPPAAVIKEIDYVSPHYRAMIETSPFVVLATCGPEGLDCSPRGDTPGFVRVRDTKTLLIPDRRGNNRIDSLRNVVRDPRVALLFLIPGIGETLRVNGRAVSSIDPELLADFAVDGKRPRSVLVVTVERVYFQCAKAVARAKLWESGSRIERSRVPSTGTILAALSDGQVGGEPYDRALPERNKAEMY